MNTTPKNNEDPRLAGILDVIFKFAAGDLTARGTLLDDESALDGVMAGINILGEELEANVAESRRALQALSESEDRLRAIFDTVQEGIVLADAQTRRFKMVNNSICRMLGYSRDELLELGVEDIHPEEDVANVVRQFERQIKREISLAPGLPVKRKDGTVFYADINATPMQAKGGTFLVAVIRDITERKRAEQAEELASHDGLTNLYNHRTFYSLLQDEIIRTQRFKRPVSLLMLDIDHFKDVNDTYGHQAGDAILKDLSVLLETQARAVDRVCRYGGEEFMVILPETEATVAMQIAERLRAPVERQPFNIGGGKTVRITVSIGVATYPQQANALEGLIKAADVALYAAKEGGRNRVTRYEAAMAEKG
ncbi:diguanylate cyclase [Rhodoferax sp.]|uniref:sensor domain-containing diguanylate cyclase n=1 Tax=Rhodoferax sp. TaxID=50421 RepID=UPI002623BDBB|nr:diguanylate cyclase [Rhodoferax sp.]MDD2920128.1 diguanylate cyclase [Rhodoferax sp.]